MYDVVPDPVRPQSRSPMDKLATGQAVRAARRNAAARSSLGTVPPGSAGLRALLELQRRNGNAYVQELVSQHSAGSLREGRCACGGIPDAAGECAACRAKRIAGETAVDAVRELDPDAPATEPDTEVLHQSNGTTTCTFPGGTPTISVTNPDAATRACTMQHEAQHGVDIRACCAGAGRAYRAATPAAQPGIKGGFFAWMIGNRAWFECRGYRESVRCADNAMSTRHCGTPAMAPGDATACTSLASYRTGMLAKRNRYCGGAGAFTTNCPYLGFFGNIGMHVTRRAGS